MEWIDVKDRIPDIEGEYLVIIKWRRPIRAISRYTFDLSKVSKLDFWDKVGVAGWYSWDDEYGWCIDSDVVAWMELPEIPEKWKENKDDK